jgi:sterol desaturase/sphingolipid hydroxylase (fatty acid hydroxylase superfamily)
MVLLGLFLLVFLESLYSFYRKDGIYSLKSTNVNVFTEVFGVIKDVFIPVLSVVTFISYIDTYIPHLFPIPVSLISFILGVFLLDLLYFLYHRLCHKLSALWMFHFVHHSDTKLNLSIAFRSSWFEMIGLFIFYSFILFLGFPYPLFISIFLFTSTYQFLTHSRYIKLPKSFEYVFVTPAYHHVHHYLAMKHQNSNFGGVFSIWDRLCSTYAGNVQSEAFGIEGYDQNNFIKIHTDPIFEYLRKRLKF